MKTELESIRELVRACGLFIRDIDRGHLHVDAKSGRTDLVTDCDGRPLAYDHPCSILARNQIASSL